MLNAKIINHMGRYGFSTNLNRAISAYSAAKKAKERETLIAAQTGKQTKAGPYFYFENFDFNKNTRVAHFTVKQVDMYRKVERYVTVNYVKNPIYSDSWSKKEKYIKKTIKLTNRELEELDNNPDELIRRFKFEIVAGMEDESLTPSWAIKYLLNEEKNSLIKAEKDELNSTLVAKRQEIKKLEEKQKELKNAIHSIDCLIDKRQYTIKKINKALSLKQNIFLAILTIGVYGFLASKFRKNKLNARRKAFEKLVSENKTKKQEKETTLNETKSKIAICEEAIENAKKTCVEKCEELEKKYYQLVMEVKPLECNQNNDENFIPLKQLIGVDYQKIMGCYVIRNKENGKCYVGQSKDVYKRVLKDHFTGTEVRNIIFAEDYYSSSFENKEDLFEVRIICCSTKDELDRKEAELIEFYDSFKNGYNGTSGNK